MRTDARRAVVTGVGAVTPIGNDAETYWRNLVAGVSGVAGITAYDASAEEVQIAAEVKGFEPRDFMDFKQARRMSRFSQLAVAAAAQALASSGLEVTDANRDDIAVIVNTGGGGIGDVALGERIFLEQGGRRVSPFMVPMLSPSMAACQISIQNDLRGPVVTQLAEVFAEDRVGLVQLGAEELHRAEDGSQDQHYRQDRSSDHTNLLPSLSRDSPARLGRFRLMMDLWTTTS